MRIVVRDSGGKRRVFSTESEYLTWKNTHPLGQQHHILAVVWDATDEQLAVKRVERVDERFVEKVDQDGNAAG